MHTFFDNKFGKSIVSIGPGEYYTSSEPLIIQTVLGSCISVCLFTDYDIIAGMNHFMLPKAKRDPSDIESDSARYGMNAMEILINTLLKSGVQRKHLKAKVFGGGNILGLDNQKDRVGDNNIQFILNYLDKENIPIISNHLGGSHARKILFFVDSKKVLLKEINKSEAFKTAKEELEYTKNIEKETQKSNIILFDN
jgi:chemotaxis protein CheD